MAATWVVSLGTSSVAASGFALIEQSASLQGLSYAGAAASTEDASVMWFNPAGLTEVAGTQAIAGVHAILPTNDFSNRASSLNGFALSGEDDPATDSLLPNLYWKGDYRGYAVGVGVNVPFGQRLQYDDDWAGRYQALETDLKSYNLNVNVARKLSHSTSVGFGLNTQYVDLTMSQKVFTGGADAEADIQADSWGYGFNVGLLSQLTADTRLGLAYRSEVQHHAKGELQSILGAQAIQSDVTLPATASVSLAHALNSRIQVLADVSWTGWKAYDELVIEDATGKPLSETDQNFQDSMRYSLGAIYNYNERWTFRTGVALDETPVPDPESRSPRTPDSDKTWFSLGLNYRFTPSVSMDVGYSHLFAAKAKINRQETLRPSGAENVLAGEYDTAVDILSAQLVWRY
jgi:long-chain fatty acid transport protein